jgi:hypothetical protein
MGKSMNWQVTVESAAGQSAATTARIVYTPPGVAHGPTFAVQDMAFHPVPMPADGALKVCDGQVELQITPDGRPPHADNLRVRWRREGAARTWQPGDLDHENLGAGFIALDNLWRDCIPQGVVPMDPLVGFDQYFWNTSALTLELEFAHQAKTGSSSRWTRAAKRCAACSAGRNRPFSAPGRRGYAPHWRGCGTIRPGFSPGAG